MYGQNLPENHYFIFACPTDLPVKMKIIFPNGISKSENCTIAQKKLLHELQNVAPKGFNLIFSCHLPISFTTEPLSKGQHDRSIIMETHLYSKEAFVVFYLLLVLLGRSVLIWG